MITALLILAVIIAFFILGAAMLGLYCYIHEDNDVDDDIEDFNI